MVVAKLRGGAQTKYAYIVPVGENRLYRTGKKCCTGRAFITDFFLPLAGDGTPIFSQSGRCYLLYVSDGYPRAQPKPDRRGTGSEEQR